MPCPPREFRAPPARALLLAALAVGLVGGCRGREAGAGERAAAGGGDSASPTAASDASAASPSAAAAAPLEDGPPQMTNPDPPFRYPAALYAQKVQGNVTLRLWVDSTGQVRPESTRVAEPSGWPALDSSAVAGSVQLRFRPAVRDGHPAAAAILFPVFFRHPESAPLPGDTVLRTTRPAPTTP